MKTYDIFLLPTETQYNKYNTIISTYSKLYKTPSFPHVTLLNLVESEEIELVTKVENIVKQYNEFEVEVFGMNFANTVSQCVFAQLKMTTQLLNLYTELVRTLNYSNPSPFFPHMSLIYGDLSSDKKSKTAQKISIDSSLILDKLVIYQDGPAPTDWRKVAEFKLN
jgi:2'-5' RNA ligase